MPPYSTFHTIIFVLFVISLQSYSSESLLHSSGRLWHPQLNPRHGTVSLLSSLLAQGNVNTSDDEECVDSGKKPLWKRMVHVKKATSSVHLVSDNDADMPSKVEPAAILCDGANNTATDPMHELDANQILLETQLDEDEDEKEDLQAIGVLEMQAALLTASKLLTSPIESIAASGWKLVHHREHGDMTINATRCFSLYKRRKAPSDGGSVEYLMTGEFSDISPVSFLSVQLDQQHRKQWDSTMKDMSTGEILLAKLWNNNKPAAPIAAPLVEAPSEAVSCNEDEDNLPMCNRHTAALKVIKDVLYYRTKWPWPMKDRDYVLARRCKIFDANNSMVLVSKSVESPLYPAVEGVIRVDNYVCHTTVLSTASVPASPRNTEVELPTRQVESHLEMSIEQMAQDSQKHQQIMQPIAAVDLNPQQQLSLDNNKQGKFRIKSTKMLHAAMSRWKNTLQPPATIASLDTDSLEQIESGVPGEGLEQKAKPRMVHTNTLYKPGMKFVTIFCDDNKVPLHPRIVDMLSKQGEKVVPDSMLALHAFAKQLELQQQNE